MKLIHTSDWHLGIDLKEHSRLSEQSMFLEFLKAQCLDHQIDALLISGDLYDVPNPSVAAQSLFTSFVVDLLIKAPQLHIIATGGNHDSALRLEIVRPFGQALGRLHLVGSLDNQDPEIYQKALIPLYDASQNLKALVFAVPFLRIGDLHCTVHDEESISEAYERSIVAFYQDLNIYAREKYPQVPLIGMGHLTLRSSQAGESELKMIGGIESIDGETLCQGYHYFALGHIHRPQKVGRPEVRYCGSPLAMDFKERHYKHQVLLVEFPRNSLSPEIQTLPLPAFVDFLQIPESPGTWEDLTRAFSAVNWQAYGKLPKERWPFVEFQLIEGMDLFDLRKQIEDLKNKQPMRMVGSVKILPKEGVKSSNSAQRTPIQFDLSRKEAPLELLKGAWHKKYQEDLPPEIQHCFEEVLTETILKGGQA